jgi:hypothetical protein
VAKTDRFEDGSSVAGCADQAAGTYGDEPDQREDGPENVLLATLGIGTAAFMGGDNGV